MSAEAWATLIAGMMQALVTLIGLFLAYMLGKNQGKYQTQHAESVRAVIEVRRRAIDAEESLGTCKNIMSSELPLWSAEDKEQALQDFKDKAWELYTYYRATRPWIWKRTTKKIEPLVWELYSTAAGLILSRIAGQLEDNPRQMQIEQEELQNWDTRMLQPLLTELDAEASRLVGTSPWWRKLFGG